VTSADAVHTGPGTASAARFRRPPKLPMVLAQRILDDIDHRGLGTGDRLPGERAMCEDYQVGRATLREALRILEDRGVVQLRSGRLGGPIVQEVSPAEVSAHMALTLRRLALPDAAALDVWRVLSDAAATLAAPRLTATCVTRLEERLSAVDGDARQAAAQRASMLDEVLEATGNLAIAVLVRCLIEAWGGASLSRSPKFAPAAGGQGSGPAPQTARIAAVLDHLLATRLEAHDRRKASS
jgi:DNA-binding FadR family transcriptional regulator